MLLDLKGVGVSFGGLKAVDDVSFSVAKGEVVGLLGPNGAGKTTLFNMIAGLVQPMTGSIEFDGRDITDRPPYWRARHGIARTFQITQPFVDLTVGQNVIVGAGLHKGPHGEMMEEAERLLAFVGLSAKINALAGSLSTGQRKRLELARALSIQPRVLLMDEVTGGVDQPSIPGLVDLVLSLKSAGKTIVVIEHNMDIVTRLCDRLIFLDRGKLLVTGKPAEVVNHPAVVELYLGQSDA